MYFLSANMFIERTDRNNMKRISAILLCALLAVSALFSCSKPEPATTTPDYEGKYTACTATDVSGNVLYTITAEYDENGNRIKETKTGPTENSVTNYEYNDAGLLCKITYISETTTEATEDITCDSKGNILTSVRHDAEGLFISRTEMTYDNEGYLTAKQYAEGDNPLETTTYTRSLADQMIYLKATTAIGTSAVAYEEYGYSANGNLQYAKFGKTSSDITKTTTYTYDDAKNLLTASTVENGTVAELLTYTYTGASK